MNKPVALVTGASRGIGSATAQKFASSGFDLVITSRNETELKGVAGRLRADYNVEVLVAAGDLANDTFVGSIVPLCEKKFGRLDVLVNNAAWRTIETMRNITLSTWKETLAVNLTAPAFLAQQSAALMEQHGGGTIINISSIMAARAGGTSPAYIACKGAINALTNELAVLYGRGGVRVVTVSPGAIDTEMSADYVNDEGANVSSSMLNEVIDFTPLRRAGTPEEIAELIFWLSTPSAAFITGTTIHADGGFLANFSSYSQKHKLFPTQF